MLKKIKGLFAIVIVFIISVTCCIVFAATREQSIQVVFDNIKILFNGDEIELKDAAGNEVEPFIYNGTTYVPIRAVSDALNKDVNWDSENNTVLINDPFPMMDPLPFDTNYVPLHDINSHKIEEHIINDNQTINNNIVFEKTGAYQKTIDKHSDPIILIDENGCYFVIDDGALSNESPSDICITKYDSNGNEINSKKYGGSDFDFANAANYNSKMGIVISAISQSTDGDFKNNSNSPFVACIDPQTLDIKWTSPVQIADFVYHVSDDFVYVVRNEGEKYDGKSELKLSLVKLDYSGEQIWATEPLPQWIIGITELSDGSLIAIQSFTDYNSNKANGAINHFDKNGVKISSFESNCYGQITATDDNGFIMVSLRNIKTIPQPAFTSSIWYDTETVVTKYDKDFNIEWRKTYDGVKDAKGIDIVLPQNNSSLIIGQN